MRIVVRHTSNSVPDFQLPGNPLHVDQTVQLRPVRRPYDLALPSAGFARVRQSDFCQGWQLCVKNATSLRWIATT
jgi:hypothetical protein